MILHAGADLLDGGCVVGLEAEPKHVESAVHVELLVLRGKLADEWLSVFRDELVEVSALGDAVGDCAGLYKEQGAFFLAFKGCDPVEVEVGLLFCSELLDGW